MSPTSTARRHGGATSLLDRLIGRLAARKQRRRLEALSDHLLTDIGITRDQIDAAFRGVLDPTFRG